MNNLLLIRDVAQLSRHSIYTIKYYLNIGLIKEVGRSPQTRFRYFNNSTLRRLTKIRKLRKQNRSIKEIQETLN